MPDEHESAPSQNTPFVQAAPSGSAALQLSDVSLQDSAQSPSPSGPRQPLPRWTLQVPPKHWSMPVQNKPSVQGDPRGSGPRQFSFFSSHDSRQSPSPSGPTHGFPVWTPQSPPLQTSSPLHHLPSSQAVLFGSAAEQVSSDSLQDSVQLPSSSGPRHGSPA